MDLDTPKWHTKAACAGAPADLWLLDDKEQGLEGKAVCATCPVLAQCLDVALTNHEKFGVWGGAGGSVRRGFGRLRLDRPHDDPGPVAGCCCGWCVALRRHVETLRVGAWAADRPPVADQNTAAARHGLRSTFNRGCRCLACTWSASKIAQRLTRLRINSADHWERWAPLGADYTEARKAADDAARPLIEHGVRCLLSALGALDPWSMPVHVDASSPRRKPD